MKHCLNEFVAWARSLLRRSNNMIHAARRHANVHHRASLCSGSMIISERLSMISSRNRNHGTCTSMWETSCCNSRGSPKRQASRWQRRWHELPGRGKGERRWALTKPRWRGPMSAHIRVLRASLFVVPLSCGLLASIEDCYSLGYL